MDLCFAGLCCKIQLLWRCFMKKIAICCLFILLTAGYSSAQEEAIDIGRYEVKNIKIKSYYNNDQGELTRWADDELVKIDTVTGTVWRWVSERTRDKKQLKEYWQEMEASITPMSEGAR
jgi:hypothetical protein